ncbi:MAG: type II toxin-antitoxin system PemK/MazF family toxin, partial [Nevskiales bacterium]
MRSYPAPSPGDIVWCRFPQREHIRPAKPRPALVLSVMDDASPVRVRVTYGTSRGTHSVAATEMLIGPENPEAYALSGLSWPTR